MYSGRRVSELVCAMDLLRLGSLSLPLNSAECMVDLAKEGKTQEEILDALRILPLVSFVCASLLTSKTVQLMPLLQHPAMKRAVTSLQSRSPDTTFVCISNSNEVYIDTILKVGRVDALLPGHTDKPPLPHDRSTA